MASKGGIGDRVNGLGTEVFTTGQVAAICQFAPRTVGKLIDAGHLKGYRIPGSNERRVLRADLEKFLRTNGMPVEWVAEFAAKHGGGRNAAS